jgi:hypothetical protein
VGHAKYLKIYNKLSAGLALIGDLVAMFVLVLKTRLQSPSIALIPDLALEA